MENWNPVFIGTESIETECLKADDGQTEVHMNH